MTIEVESAGSLAATFGKGGLYRSWLCGEPILARPSAAEDLYQVVSGQVKSGQAKRAPLWQEPEFAALLPTHLQDLEFGPDVVVTGQQPGYLGGPLYTLYKIATAIVLAKRRSEMGTPTVPVFWSGDDDDDLAEALAPVGWHLSAQVLWQSPARSRLRDPATQRAVLAGVSADVWADLSWPASETGNPTLTNLSQILAEATPNDQSWGPGQTELIAAVFAGTDLVIIRGDDERLHRTASPFYERLWVQNTHLQELVADRGAALGRAGFQAQINARSIANNMFSVQSGRRQKIDSTGEQPTDWSVVRPGVMLRSLVQDWLLQPAAVVVGPGEFAYLRQLDPLYSALELPRCPLVPRLSSWVMPSGLAGKENLTRAQAILVSGPQGDESRLHELAESVVSLVRDKMSHVLRDEWQVPAERADAMAANRARRFRKGVLAMFASENERQKKELVADIPPWLLPHGKPQERSLGWLSALEIWGAELVPAIMTAAAEHIEAGANGSWQQFALRASDGKVSW